MENNIGVAAAENSPNRAWVNFPLVGNPEASSWALQKIWRRARSLYCNSPEVRFCVNTLASMVGTLTPRPQSGNEEWDKLAREAFLKRVNNPGLFDANGVLSWNQAQLFCEKKAIVDGDVLTVLTGAKDGGGSVQIYSAPQITSNGKHEDPQNCGVEVDANGKVKGYWLYDWKSEKPFYISAGRSILYRHNPDPMNHRGASELTPAINVAKDLSEVLGYNVQSIKWAAMFAIIETQDPQVKSSIGDLAALRNPARVSGTPATQVQPAQPQQPVLGTRVGESQAITMSPGHHLELLHDTRPSTEQMNFIRKLIDSIGLAVGIDPVLLFSPQDMNSASVRFVIAKSKDTINQRLQDRINWCQRIYEYILSCEVRAGRLPKCPTDAWNSVRWVASGNWSIDLSHDASSATNLISKGLMSADDFCLTNYGKTSEEIFAENLHSVSHNIERCKEAGIDYYMVAAPNQGATYIPEQTQVTEKEETTDDDGLVETK